MQCDMNPDAEIAIWEAIASAYSAFTHARERTHAERERAFYFLFTLSMMPAEEAEWSFDDPFDAEVANYYSGSSSPILVARVRVDSDKD